MWLVLLLLPSVWSACPDHPSPTHGSLVASPWQADTLAIRCEYGMVPLGTGVANCLGDDWSEVLECGEAVALLVGGDEQSGYSLRTEIFPPYASGCIKVPHLPQPTHGGAGGWVGGMAVVCGGEPQPFAMTSECFGYSVQDNLWLELPSLSSSRSMASGVVVDGALLVTGGYDKDYFGTDISEVWVPGMGLESPWIPQPSLPHTRSDHCSVNIGEGVVVVTGNYPEVNSVNMKETSILAVDGEGKVSWEARRDMATGRDEHGCSQVSFDGGVTVEVMVAGGPNSRESEIYNPASDTWRSAASFDHTAFGPGMAVIEGKPTVMGGYETNATPRDQDRVVQYDMETDTWTELPQKLEAGRHAILTIPVPRQIFCPLPKLG